MSNRTNINLVWKRGQGLFVSDDKGTSCRPDQLGFVGEKLAKLVPKDKTAASQILYCSTSHFAYKDAVCFEIEGQDKIARVRKERTKYPAVCILQKQGRNILLINVDLAPVTVDVSYRKTVDNISGYAIIAHAAVAFPGLEIFCENVVKTSVNDSMVIRTRYEEAVKEMSKGGTMPSLETFDALVQSAREHLLEHIQLMQMAEEYTVEDFKKEEGIE